MKFLPTILLFLTACTSTRLDFTATANKNSVVAGSDSAKFFTGDESAVKKYLVEYGRDTLHYKTIGTVLPGKNIYTYQLPDSTGFVRIHSTGPVDFYTRTILHRTNKVSITNATYSATSLKWTVTSEKNVGSYLIEKSSDGKTWSKTTTVSDKGNPGTYTYRYSKTTKKYSYRLTPIYNDGTKGITTSFK